MCETFTLKFTISNLKTQMLPTAKNFFYEFIKKRT